MAIIRAEITFTNVCQDIKTGMNPDAYFLSIRIHSGFCKRISDNSESVLMR